MRPPMTMRGSFRPYDFISAVFGPDVGKNTRSDLNIVAGCAAGVGAWIAGTVAGTMVVAMVSLERDG